MTRTRALLISLIIFLGAGAFILLRPSGGEPSGESGAGERKISYWAAPMDPNYRGDGPGKSPMGMDLIPVYEGEDTGGEPSLLIDPSVVNNIGVKTRAVMREDLAREINTVGAIMIDEEARADINVRSEGWVEKLYVEAVGEKVERGDILFELYAPALVAAQSEFIQALKIGRPALVRAATERLTALGMNESQIADLKRSRNVRQRVDILAPQSGVVIGLKAREGMFLRRNDMAMQLADLSSVWIIADVFENNAQWAAPGDAAQMTLPAFPGEVWEGEVDYVYPTAEMTTRTVQVRLRFPNHHDRLKPNMFANVRISAAPKKHVLTIPQSALIRTSKGDRVILALGGGRFRPAQVTTGIESDGKVEIHAGLDEGENIVVESQFLIDSEASLNAGLLRLSAPPELDDPAMEEMDMTDGEDMSSPETDDQPMEGMDMTGDEMEPSERPIGSTGRVVSIDMESKSITIDHEPVPEIGWPAMTMAFKASPDIDMNAVENGATVRFALRQTEDGYELADVTPMPKSNAMGDQQ